MIRCCSIMNKYHSFFLFNVHPCNCAICPFLPYVLPLTYNPIAHSLIHGRLRAPTAMISPGAVCNLYCMFLWQRGERLARGRVVLPYSQEGNVERRERKRESCALERRQPRTQRMDGWKVGWPHVCSPCSTVPHQQFSTL